MSTLNFVDNGIGWNNLLIIWVMNLFVFAVYILIVRLFLFKSEWLINKLKLDKGFAQEKLDITFPAQNVLRIVIIITGALIFVQGLPNLIQGIFEFFQQKDLIKNYTETSWLIYHFLRTLFGYLIMTNSKSLEKILSKESQNGL